MSLHASGPDSPVQWLTATLRVGDEVTIRVVDTSEFEGVQAVDVQLLWS